MEPWLVAILCVVLFVVGAGIASLVTYLVLKVKASNEEQNASNKAKKLVSDAEEKAKKMIEEADSKTLSIIRKNKKVDKLLNNLSMMQKKN